MGFLVSAVAFPRVGPAQEAGIGPAGPSALPEPTSPTPSASTPTLASPPPQPTSPFGPAAGVFPTLSPSSGQGSSSGTAAPLQNPFQPALGVFPTLTPTTGTTSSPSGLNPTTTPSLLSTSPRASQQTGGNAQAVPGGLTAPVNPSGEALPDKLTGNPAAPIPVAPPPLTPAYGYGVPAPPLAFPGPTYAAAPPAAPNYTALAPIAPGAAPIQAGDLRAPPVLIGSNVYVSEGYTDNPRNTRQTFSDSITRLRGATNISIDTVRLQGQLSDSSDYSRFMRAHDENSLNSNLSAFGLATIIRDHLYVDGRAAFTPLSRVGGVGFANSNIIRPSQQTQAFVTSFSPIARGSFGDLFDAELRYNYSADIFNNGSLLNNTTPSSASSLTDTTQNEVTLSVATGRAFSLITSKLTLDAIKIDSGSAARSTQLQIYDDLEYAINARFSILGRFGYEDLRYPLQPAATTTGPIWLIGGRYTPSPGDYLLLRYGTQSGTSGQGGTSGQNGTYGFDGSLHYQLTARTAILASYDSSLSSSQQNLVNNLNAAQLSSNGVIVNSVTGLPLALSNPEFAYAANNVYRNNTAQVGMQTTLDRDTFGLNAVFDHRDALGSQPVGTSAVAGTDTTYGINFNWSRSLTPSLTGGATLGFARDIASDQRTLNSDLTFSYTFSDRLSGVLHYQFVNVTGNTVALTSGTTAGPYTRNLIEIGLTRNF